jgi:hypothetical protein
MVRSSHKERQIKNINSNGGRANDEHLLKLEETGFKYSSKT